MVLKCIKICILVILFLPILVSSENEGVIFGSVTSEIVEEEELEGENWSISFECVYGFHVDRTCISERVLPDKLKKFTNKMESAEVSISDFSHTKYYSDLREEKILTKKYLSYLEDNKDKSTLKSQNKLIVDFKKNYGIEENYHIYLDTDGIDIVPTNSFKDATSMSYNKFYDWFNLDVARAILDFSENIIIIDYFNRTLFYDVFKKSKVYISSEAKIPSVDPVGNVYIPAQLYDTCKNKCIEVILLHEAIHVIMNNSKVPAFLKGLDNIININEISDYDTIKYQLNKASTYQSEALIDLRVLYALKNKPKYRKAYIDILERYLIDNEGEGLIQRNIRMKMVHLINDYINKYDTRIFDIIDERNILLMYEKHSLISQLDKTESITLFFIIFDSILERNNLSLDSEEVNMIIDYFSLDKKYLKEMGIEDVEFNIGIPKYEN